MNKSILYLSISVLLTYTPVFSQQKKIDHSIFQAIAYLNESKNTIDLNNALIINYISKKHQLTDLLWLDVESIHPLNDDEKHSLQEFSHQLKLKTLRNNKMIDSVYSHSNDIEHLLIWGLNSDILPFDSLCDQTIKKYKETTSNIRNQMHVVLAFEFSNSEQHWKKFEHLKSIYKNNFKNYIQNNSLVDDTWLEAALGYSLLLKNKRIPKTWINNIISAQQSNGGWKWNPNLDSESHPHSSLLALWILLDNK